MVGRRLIALLGLLAVVMLLVPLDACKSKPASSLPIVTSQSPTSSTISTTSQPPTGSMPSTVSQTPATTTTLTTNPPSTTNIPSSTLAPTATTTTPVQTMKMSDATSDLFDNNNHVIAAEPYLDIVEAEASIIGTNYLFRMKLNSPLPTRIDDPAVSIEWDFFIDADRNSSTGWNYQVAANDIGPDFLVSLSLSGAQFSSLLYDIAANKYTSLVYKVAGDTIDISFTWSLMGQIATFDCVAAARKWVQTAPNQKSLAVVDKVPNAGHYNLPAGYIYIKPGPPTLQMASEHAAIWYNEGNDAYARYVAQAFELGYVSIGKELGVYTQKFTIYTYITQNDLVQGLQTFSGFSASSAAYFRSAGMTPRPLNFVMHVPPNFSQHTIVHEYAHAALEEIGGQAYKSIKWLDEGLAEELAYTTMLMTAEKDKEVKWGLSRVTVAKNALAQGRLFSLTEISTESQWSARSGADYDLGYAEAFAITSYAVSKYGLSKCVDILRFMKAGDSQEMAVQKALGVSVSKLESDFRAYLVTQ